MRSAVRLVAAVPVFVALVAPSVVDAAWDGLIRVWFDAEFSVCWTQQPLPGNGGTAYVTAQVSWEHRAVGLVGAEFRLTGLPPGWDATATPNPAADAVAGDPFGPGCSISFPSALGAGPEKVLLFSVQYVPSSSVGPTLLSVEASLAPLVGAGQCPIVVLGDLPVRTRVCCPSGPVAAWNDPTFCSTATRAATWTVVRRLFD